MWFVEGKAFVRSKKTQEEEEEEEESGEFVRRGEVRREGQSSATALEKLQEKRELRALALRESSACKLIGTRPESVALPPTRRTWKTLWLPPR
uniref:Uncharacterized protein n=1 Tax=Vespula pensylvanica TaxID=30213 RepID=A0A834U9F5_VESPE|nr:hypothetical protein H0235_008781 [Vespula pensylvanica]